MSEILIASNGDTVVPQTADDKASQLPRPSGYRILCAIPEVEKEYESGLLKAEKEDFEQREELVLRFILEKCSASKRFAVKI
jgi:hypothetical protein